MRFAKELEHHHATLWRTKPCPTLSGVPRHNSTGHCRDASCHDWLSPALPRASSARSSLTFDPRSVSVSMTGCMARPPSRRRRLSARGLVTGSGARCAVGRASDAGARPRRVACALPRRPRPSRRARSHQRAGGRGGRRFGGIHEIPTPSRAYGSPRAATRQHAEP